MPSSREGFTWEGIRWAFTALAAANWHPLTWLSHMLDVSLFGLDPGFHHLVNLLFHLLNTALLFFVLKAMTGACWRSAFVAALFALHPLHVESVAWIAERKDVLSTFFGLLAIGAYVPLRAETGMAEIPSRRDLLLAGPHGETHAGHPSPGSAADGFLAARAAEAFPAGSLVSPGPAGDRKKSKKKKRGRQHPNRQSARGTGSPHLRSSRKKYR